MRKKKLPSLVTIAFLSTITVIFWTALEVYRALTLKPAPIVPAKILAPLDPSLDAGSLNKLQKRVYIKELDLIQNLPTPTPEPEVTATDEGSLQ